MQGLFVFLEAVLGFLEGLGCLAVLGLQGLQGGLEGVEVMEGLGVLFLFLYQALLG